jgi:hypothetical protein
MSTFSSPGSRPTVICLTPVKNESWILDRFLQCASTWADHIIVADQQSDDDSCRIAGRYEKVHLIDNTCDRYDEAARQRLLINAARQIPTSSHRILLALDADEILSANWMESPEWTELLNTAPGTVLRFQWANIAPGVKHGWIDADRKIFGFVDDGSPHVGQPIHSPRLPNPDGAPTRTFSDLRILHYQYVNWDRMKSKQRWYQCWERLNSPDKRPITIYRQYHRMDPYIDRAVPLRPEWIQGYERMGIDMRTVETKQAYYWDDDIVRLLRDHGTEPFQRLDIWDRDWTAVGRYLGYDVNGELRDPRSAFERRVHAWLSRTQARSDEYPIRAAQKLLQIFGW